MGESSGISGVWRSGAGQYILYFSPAMSTANYAVVFGSTGNDAAQNVQTSLAGGYGSAPYNKTTTSVSITSGMTNAAAYRDSSNISVAILGN